MRGNSLNILWINTLRAIATVSVIILHVSAPIVLKFNAFSSNWLTANLFESLVRFSVPVFLMISGVLAFGKPIKTVKFLQKKILRVILPFIFWYLIYVLYQTLTTWHQGLIFNYKSGMEGFLFNLTHSPSPHLWYIYLILGLYLCFPFLNQWLINTTNRKVHFFLISWAIFTQIDYFQLNNFFSGNYLKDILLHIGYPVLGYYLTFKIHRISRFVSLTLIISGFIITALATYYLSLKQGSFVESPYSFIGFNVLLSSIGIFTFFQNLTLNNQILLKISNTINLFSYGIYLSHILSLSILGWFNINGFLLHPCIGIPLSSLSCLVISIFICFIMQQIPYGNLFSGIKKIS